MQRMAYTAHWEGRAHHGYAVSIIREREQDFVKKLPGFFSLLDAMFQGEATMNHNLMFNRQDPDFTLIHFTTCTTTDQVAERVYAEVQDFVKSYLAMTQAENTCKL